MDFKLRNDMDSEAEPEPDITPRRWPLMWIALGLSAIGAAAFATWVTCCPPQPTRPASTDSRPTTSAPQPRPAEPTAEPAPAPETTAPRANRRSAAPVAPVPAAAPEAALDSGSLDVQSDVTGASVFVDREYQGQAPLTIPKLSLGSHQVNVSAEGYEGIARSIEISPGANSMAARFKDVTLDAAIPVVHRHGMGSCEGRLIASVDGLRYETSNRQDRFSLPFADLTGFEVDYLKKNLRLERRGGRSYNFTDKQATADALFVFHRDVENARSRLGAASVAR